LIVKLRVPFIGRHPMPAKRRVPNEVPIRERSRLLAAVRTAQAFASATNRLEPGQLERTGGGRGHSESSQCWGFVT
jgi:hypothetical protein